MNKKILKHLIVALGLTMCLGVFAACGSGNSSTSSVSDNSVDAVEQAESGSDKELSGKYIIDGLKGAYYLFGENGTGVLQQDGTYENAKKTIDLKDDNSDFYTKYQKEKTKDGVKLTTMIEGAEQQNEVTYTLISGDDKLMSEDMFNAIYKIAGFDDSRMVFNDNGTYDYVQDFTYEINDDQISITQNGSQVTYKWKAKDGKILLKSGGTVITKLLPAETGTE